MKLRQIPGEINEMVYLLDEEDGTSVYVMYLNGVPVFYAYANKNVMDMPVQVSKPETDAPRYKIDGVRAYLVDDMTRVAGPSVQAATIPQLPWILSALYVPQD